MLDDYISDLYFELACKELGKYVLQHINTCNFPFAEIVKDKAYQALDEIRTVIQDEEADDYQVVEAIVVIFEKYGIDAGYRHDEG